MDGLTSEVTTLTVTLATILAPIPTLTLLISYLFLLLFFPLTLFSSTICGYKPAPCTLLMCADYIVDIKRYTGHSLLPLVKG